MPYKDIVYITGHKHPDSDSIASSIAYAFFKRAMGVRAVAARAGHLNAETKWLLDRFGFEKPYYMKDARVRLSEINLDPPISVSPDATIFDTLEVMEKEKHNYCGVVDADGKLVGLVGKGDFADVGLGDTAYNINFLSTTPVENFAKTVNGHIVYNDETPVQLNGRVSIVAMTDREHLSRYQIQGRIVIVGDSEEAQIAVIRGGAGLLVVVWADSVSDAVIAAAKECHCPIIISGHGATNTSRYLYFAPPVKTLMKTDLVSFYDYELAEDVGKKMLRSRYHAYPVIDDAHHLVGYATRYHIMNARNKKLILVDHNEFSQSVTAADEAQILEVIDHHRINGFSSTQPISFRNEIVGSTATIIATIYRENQIPIPPNLAGLLLGALLSDTMDFHSPTTTDKDRQTANILAAMADLDIDEFAKEMFAVSADTQGKSIADMINQDIKFYEISGCKLAISQIITASIADTQTEGNVITAEVESFASRKQLDLEIAVFTSITENGSVVYAGGKRADWAVEAFPDKEHEEHSFQEGLMSRKQQILPQITKVIQRYMG